MPLVPDDASVFSYELQIDDGLGGLFTSVAGYTHSTMETEYTLGSLVTSRTYRLRYRVLNYVGWSTFSPYLYV